MGETLIETTVIGGYLGSGKTTLLRQLLENTEGERIAVLVNDFGEVAIDASLIRSVTDDMIELSNGCVCCTIAGGFIEALVRLLQRPDPPLHLVIEASGVSDPATIADLGHMPGYRRGATVVVVDAERIRAHLADPLLASTIRRSIGAADLLICNKVDLISPDNLAEVHTILAELSESPVIDTTRAAVAPAVVLATPRGEHHTRHGETSPHPTHWVDTLHFDEPLRRDALESFLCDLPPGIVRVKALLRIVGEPVRVVVHAVGRRWEIETAPADDHEPDAMVVVSILGPVDSAAIAATLGVQSAMNR